MLASLPEGFQPHMLSALLIGIWSLGTANATELTDVPPKWMGDVHIDYGAQLLWGGIDEGDVRIGYRKVVRHDLTFGLEFAAYHGIAVNLAFPVTARVNYGFWDSLEMNYDPVSGLGSATSGDSIEDYPETTGSGLNGVWIGLAFAPFSENYDHGDQASWRLDIGLRTPSKKNNLWTVNKGKRGSGNGGTALKLAGAFSSKQGVAEPYIAVEYVMESKVTLDIVDEEGTTWASDVEIRPASRIDARAGVEIIGSYNAESDVRIAVDVYSRFGYRSWSDVPSGLYLPSVLDTSRMFAVTSGEHILVAGGLGFDAHVHKYAGFRFGVEGRYYTPYRLEHTYAARTSTDSFELLITFDVIGRVRY